MPNFQDYLDFSERHLASARDEESAGRNADIYLVPSAILAWCAVESFINDMLSDFRSVPPEMFQIHELAFLQEMEVQFIDRGDRYGEFELKGRRYRRLEEKILFLLAKSGKNIGGNPKGTTLWQNLEKSGQLRDQLVHLKRENDIELSSDVVSQVLETSREIIRILAKAIWNKSLGI